MADDIRALLGRLRARADECGIPSTGGRHLCTKDEFLRLLAVCAAALLQAERHPTDTISEVHAALRALKETDHG